MLSCGKIYSVEFVLTKNQPVAKASFIKYEALDIMLWQNSVLQLEFHYLFAGISQNRY